MVINRRRVRLSHVLERTPPLSLFLVIYFGCGAGRFWGHWGGGGGILINCRHRHYHLSVHFPK